MFASQAHEHPGHGGRGALSSLQVGRPRSGLSHGTAGIAWTLAELASRSGEARFREAALGALAYLDDEKLGRQVRRIATSVFESLERQARRSRGSLGLEPGLMVGLAGSGYGLLGLAAPGEVPSILALERPLNLEGPGAV